MPSVSAHTSRALPKHAHPPRLRVACIAVERFTLTALAGFVDCLRLAADDDDRSRPIDCTWTLLGDPARPIRSSCGIAVLPWQPLGDPAEFDYIVVVGGLLHGGQHVDRETFAFLRAAAEQGIPLIGLCTGSFVLARAGLMTGYRCCVSWFHHQDFVAEFPELKVVSDELFVVDRDRMTCAGGTSVSQLAAYLVERHCGKPAASKSLRILIEEQALPAGTPQPMPSLAADARDPVVRHAILLMEQRLNSRPSVEDVACTLGLSVRQLERRFRTDLNVSPQTLWLRLRLEQGRWMLEHTTRPITEIALECGFSDGAHFARMFRQNFGRVPTSVRARRQSPPFNAAPVHSALAPDSLTIFAHLACSLTT